MAAVYVPPSPSPQAPSVIMSNRRRAPLSNVPNGTNSPHRAGGLIPTIKRSHPAATQLENLYGPPFKKQHTLAPATTLDDRENHAPTATATTIAAAALDPDPTSANTVSTTTATSTMSAATTMRSSAHQLQGPASNQTVTRRSSNGIIGGNAAEKAKLFTRPSNNATPSAFERKLVASREQSKAAVTARNHGHATAVTNNGAAADRIARAKHNAQTLENLRTWQRHYKSAFPSFVFYFDSLPDDMRHKVTRQILALGAKEEKFFSKSVTHVVTTRPIPPEIDASSHSKAHGNDAASMNKAGTVPGADMSTMTVNPSMLEKTREGAARFDSRSMNNDVLHRARQMRMKIWAWEKVQRVISTINDPGTALLAASGAYGRQSNAATSKRTRDSDLSLALRNERLNASIDPARELIPFKGPYIYLHCAFETYRPIIVKEYPKVSRKSQGSWPQFRSATAGKCPFVEDPMAIQQTARELERKNLLRTHQLEAEKRRLSKVNSVSKTRMIEDGKDHSRISPSVSQAMRATEHGRPSQCAHADNNGEETINLKHTGDTQRYEKTNGRLHEGETEALRAEPRATERDHEEHKSKHSQPLGSLRAKLDAAAKALEESDESCETDQSETMSPSGRNKHEGNRLNGEVSVMRQNRNAYPVQMGHEQESTAQIGHRTHATAAPEEKAAIQQPKSLKRPAPDDTDREASRFKKPTSNYLLERLAIQNRSLGLQGLANAREPAASGVQPSNITSAIRSQMISSATAGTGAKAATSKEVHELKRKVLENSVNGPIVSATNKSTASTDHVSLLEAKLRRVLEPKGSQAQAPQHVHGGGATHAPGARKVKGTLDEVEDDWAATKTKASRGAHTFAANKRANPAFKREARDPKPGYCENCRDKFEDFEEHITSRKHRKFAMTASNWVALDHILDYIHSPGYQNMAQRSVTSWDPSDDEEKY